MQIMEFNAQTYTFTNPGRFGRTMTIVGVAGVLLSLLGLLLNPGQFYFSWLVAFSFWVTIALGGLFAVMIHWLTGATWSVVVRRIGEAVMATLPWFVLPAIVVLLGAHHIYSWSDPAEIAAEPGLLKKVAYLNVPFFTIRAIFYFAVWSFLALRLRKLSLAQDAGWSPDAKHKFLTTSAPGTIAYALTVTFAGFDWWMSLQPLWYSTIYGVYFFSGGIMSIMAMYALVVHGLHAQGVLTREITVEHKHDIGKLLFAFMVFWAYMALSQYLLIWYANLPEETTFFKARWIGSWKPVSVFLAVGGFAIPFVLLMSRTTKRSRWGLSIFAIWLLAMHWVDTYWNVMPVFHKQGVVLSWMDLTTFVGIGGLFLALFWRFYTGAPLLPVSDPKLQDSIEFVNH